MTKFSWVEEATDPSLKDISANDPRFADILNRINNRTRRGEKSRIADLKKDFGEKPTEVVGESVESDSDSKHYITISYDTYSYDDLEAGDTDNRGWEDEEGESMEPDEYDVDEGITVIDKTVKYLNREGATNGSEYGRNAASETWSTEGESDYSTGDVTTKYYHLNGYTRAELIEIQNRMEGKTPKTLGEVYSAVDSIINDLTI